MAWFSGGNTERNLQKLEKILRFSNAANAHKKNYNAAAAMLVRSIKPKVNNGTIQGSQKNRFRAMYNKVNNKAISAYARKIVNDPNMMKRFFNRQSPPQQQSSWLFPSPKNANFERKLRKLEAIVMLSRRFNKHKKNYNAAAMIILRNIQPRVNNGSIKGAQRNNFLSVHRKLTPIVNMAASSPYAVKIVNNPYAMRQYFNRQNRAVPAPIPPPPRPANVRPRPLNVRSRTGNVRPRPLNARRPNIRPSGAKACVVKRIGFFGQTVCK